MTAPAPEKAAPIPAEVLSLARNAVHEHRSLNAFSRVLRLESIIARAIMQDRADREARPSLPDSREERIREDDRAWRFDVENAPRDRMIDAVGRYPEATAGFPVYVGWQRDGWYSFSRNEPERMVIWAWRERPNWPREPVSE